MRPSLIALCAAVALSACSRPAQQAATPPAATPAAEPALPATASWASKSDAPAGAYTVDPSHTSLVFRVSHLGFSNYTARFDKVDAALTFDPAHPEAMSVQATIDPRSLGLPTPPKGFKETLIGPQWLDAAK